MRMFVVLLFISMTPKRPSHNDPFFSCCSVLLGVFSMTVYCCLKATFLSYAEPISDQADQAFLTSTLGLNFSLRSLIWLKAVTICRFWGPVESCLSRSCFLRCGVRFLLAPKLSALPVAQITASAGESVLIDTWIQTWQRLSVKSGRCISMSGNVIEKWILSLMFIEVKITLCNFIARCCCFFRFLLLWCPLFPVLERNFGIENRHRLAALRISIINAPHCVFVFLPALSFRDQN